MIEKKQINSIYQYFAILHLCFHEMKSALKALTQHVNSQWKIKTSTTPVNMKYDSIAEHESRKGSH